MSSGEEYYDAFERIEQIQDFRKRESLSMLSSFTPISELTSRTELLMNLSDFPSFLSSSSPTSRVKKRNKEFHNFNGLEAVQSMSLHSSIWIIKFSPDARFLAIGCEDGSVYLFEVTRNPCQLISDRPYSMHIGHTARVTALCWSRSSTCFVSSSLDASIRIWEIGSADTIGLLNHEETVTCVGVHPIDSGSVFSGSGKMIRIWDISSLSVWGEETTTNSVTAGTFTPEGDRLLIGLECGVCLVYSYQLETRKLVFLHKIVCKNGLGRLRKGKPVVGFDFAGEHLVAITTHDSRIRLFDLRDYTCRQKYRGTCNKKSPITASVSSDKEFILCGSETGEIYIWNLINSHVPIINPRFTRRKQYKNSSYEFFNLSKDKNGSIAVFAPNKIVMRAIKEDISVLHIIVGASERTLKIIYNQS